MYNSKFFSDDEFKRVGCSRFDVQDDSLRRLDRAREIAGIPFRLTSAYRSPESDKKKGRSGNSAHTRGVAFDVACTTSFDRYLIVFAALAAGFRRVGIASNFVHMDDDTTLPGPFIWLY